MFDAKPIDFPFIVHLPPISKVQYMFYTIITQLFISWGMSGDLVRIRKHRICSRPSHFWHFDLDVERNIAMIKLFASPSLNRVSLLYIIAFKQGDIPDVHGINELPLTVKWHYHNIIFLPFWWCNIKYILKSFVLELTAQ